MYIYIYVITVDHTTQILIEFQCVQSCFCRLLYKMEDLSTWPLNALDVIEPVNSIKWNLLFF